MYHDHKRVNEFGFWSLGGTREGEGGEGLSQVDIQDNQTEGFFKGVRRWNEEKNRRHQGTRFGDSRQCTSRVTEDWSEGERGSDVR